MNLIEGAVLTEKYGFPIIRREKAIPTNPLPFHMALTEKEAQGKWVHFFVDDYQFERIWNFPARYLPVLKRFDGVFAPDFSMYENMPEAQRIWNCYRSRAFSHYLQSNDVPVIPVVEWGFYSDLDWCLDGLPKGSTIAVGNYGCCTSSAKRYGFIKGVERFCRELQPSALICYGDEISSIKSLCKQVVFLENYCKTMKKRL